MNETQMTQLTIPPKPTPAPPTPQSTPQLLNFLDWVLSRCFRRIGMAVVAGNPGAGKTDIGLLTPERLYHLDLIREAATNVNQPEGSDWPEWLLHIHTLPKLKAWLDTRKVRKLYLFDDASEYIPRSGAISRQNIAITSIIPTIRKKRARILWVTQEPGWIDKKLYADKFFLAYIEKNRRTSARFVSRFLMPHGERTVNKLPRTSIPFDSMDIAPFEMTDEDLAGIIDESDKSILSQIAQGKPVSHVTSNKHWMEVIRRHLRTQLGMDR